MENLVNESLASFYKGKKVFVTGHTGFKGAWLITWLQGMGADVMGYALAPEEGLFNIVYPRISIKSVIADIRDAAQLRASILDFQPDLVFHLAAQALVRRSYEIPAETFEVNVVGTANLLEAVKELGKQCSVVVVTTDKVYENIEADHYYNEGDVLGGYDPYSASKAAAEIVVSSFRNAFFHPDDYASHKKCIASARAGNVIGGGDWSKDRIIPDIIRSLSAGLRVDVRNPDSVRPWQHVLEPLGGYLLLGQLLHSGGIRFSGAYNFAPLPDDHLPVKELVELALDCWGREGLAGWVDRSDNSQPHEAGLLKLSMEKAKKVLKWYPRLNGKKAIEWTINWYKQPAEKCFEFTVHQINEYQLL